MNVCRLLAYTSLACALAGPSPAQEAEETTGAEREAEARVLPRGPLRQVRRVVEVRNRDIIQELRMLASELGVGAHASGELGVITLLGPEDAVAIAEDTIRRFDRPNAGPPEPGPRNADFTAYLVVARPEGEAAPVPEVLESVVAQLEGVLPYARYELLETVTLRVADEGRGGVSGILPPISPGLSGRTYSIILDNVRLPGEGSDRPPAGWVSLHPILQLKMSLAEGSGERTVSSGIEARIEILEGQKVVVGKASIDGAGTSLILVLTMKLDG